jgi:hypothetical protein
MLKLDHNIRFQEKRQFFRTKGLKMAKNSNNYIDLFVVITLITLTPSHYQMPRTTYPWLAILSRTFQ